MHWGDMPGWGWGGWFLSGLAMLVVLAALATLLVLALNRRPAPRPPDPAEQLLAERYARGDITEEEYRRRLDALRELRSQE